jgi:1-phosphatidylinositol-4-phosphate 5-kinase
LRADEAWETVSETRICNLNQPLETKSYTYTSGAVYEGQWLGGLRHGKGSMTWLDGTTFEGHWEFNAAYGEGTIEQPGSDSYKGNWRNNMFFGQGCYQNK